MRKVKETFQVIRKDPTVVSFYLDS